MSMYAKPRLSKTSKLGARSWSLNAGDTCPGSYADGELVAACIMCYAKSGNYRFKNVKAPRDHNRADWLHDDWVSAMVRELDNDRWFRWFDSGDMYHLKLAEKMLEVMKATPWVKHWLPTRMYKFPKFARVLKEMEALPNVVVRYSSDSITGETVPGLNSSTIIPSGEFETDAFICGSSMRDGKCGDCRACWDKGTPIVAYIAHGQKKAKTYRSIGVTNI